MAGETYEFFNLQREGDVAVFHVTVREMRHPTAAQQFGAEVRSALQSSGLNRALIDMHEVEYVGSTAFATLLVLAKAVTGQGGVLKLCDLHPDVQVGAKILGLGNAVEIHPDRRSALESFKAA